MAYQSRNFRTDRALLPWAIYGLAIIAALAALFVALSGVHISGNSVPSGTESLNPTAAPLPRTN